VGKTLAQRGDADGGQGVVDAPPQFLRRQPHVPGTEGHVFLDRHADDLMLGVLERHAHAAADLRNGAPVPRVEAVDGDGAFAGQKEGVELADQRRFAAAVGADEADVFALVDRERSPAQRRLVRRFVGEGHPVGDNHRKPPRNGGWFLRIRTMKTAAAILAASPGRKGSTPTARAFAGERRATSQSWATPKA